MRHAQRTRSRERDHQRERATAARRPTQTERVGAGTLLRKLVGALGVSGGSGAQDHASLAGIAAVK